MLNGDFQITKAREIVKLNKMLPRMTDKPKLIYLPVSLNIRKSGMELQKAKIETEAIILLSLMLVLRE